MMPIPRLDVFSPASSSFQTSKESDGMRDLAGRNLSSSTTECRTTGAVGGNNHRRGELQSLSGMPKASQTKKRRGLDLLRLDWSSHSPDANPIENVWSGGGGEGSRQAPPWAGIQHRSICPRRSIDEPTVSQMPRALCIAETQALLFGRQSRVAKHCNYKTSFAC